MWVIPLLIAQEGERGKKQTNISFFLGPSAFIGSCHQLRKGKWVLKHLVFT